MDGVTGRHLVDAIRAGDLARVRAMLQVRPELARMSIDNLQLLHYAVLDRAPEIVRLLMEHGANAREGVYPHREATSALAIASQRGYDEVVIIIKEQEQRRHEAQSDLSGVSEPEEFFRATASGDVQRSIAMIEANPALIQARDHLHGWTALDQAAYSSNEKSIERFAAVAKVLLSHGAELTPAAAVALGDVDWLRARHAAGVLTNRIEDGGGLLRTAASHNRPNVLAVLLDFGFDPDERSRIGNGDDIVLTSGMPLYHCAGSGKHEMAEMLLQRGADANASVFASGDPLFQAYSRCDWKMVKLLERYGSVPTATTAGLYRQTELARKMLTGEANYRLDGVGGNTLAEQLLWGAACGGDPEIVGMALERVDWPRDDPRWFEVLEQPLRIWTHGSGSLDWDRGTYLTCFRLLLERCDPNIRGRVQDRGHFGLTILHSVAGSREHMRAEERVAFATMLFNAGARLDVRDKLLKSTPLGWACRWGHIELVKLFLRRGANPLEPDAEPWATPMAWAQKLGHDHVLTLLREHGS